jgi:hypothetical protein
MTDHTPGCAPETSSIRPYEDADRDTLVKLWYESWHSNDPLFIHPDPMGKWIARWSDTRSGRFYERNGHGPAPQIWTLAANWKPSSILGSQLVIGNDLEYSQPFTIPVEAGINLVYNLPPMIMMRQC